MKLKNQGKQAIAEYQLGEGGKCSQALICLEQQQN